MIAEQPDQVGLKNGLPQLVRVHLAQTLEPGHRRDDRLAGLFQLRDGLFHLALGVGSRVHDVPFQWAARVS